MTNFRSFFGLIIIHNSPANKSSTGLMKNFAIDCISITNSSNFVRKRTEIGHKYENNNHFTKIILA